MLPFHEAGRIELQSRFSQLSKIMTCATFTNYPSSSHGAYAWVQCKEEEDCMELFAKVNLIPESGSLFGSTKQCKEKLYIYMQSSSSNRI